MDSNRNTRKARAASVLTPEAYVAGPAAISPATAIAYDDTGQFTDAEARLQVANLRADMQTQNASIRTDIKALQAQNANMMAMLKDIAAAVAVPSAPPVSAPAVSASPVSAPAVSAPPASAPPVSALPVSAPAAPAVYDEPQLSSTEQERDGQDTLPENTRVKEKHDTSSGYEREFCTSTEGSASKRETLGYHRLYGGQISVHGDHSDSRATPKISCCVLFDKSSTSSYVSAKVLQALGVRVSTLPPRKPNVRKKGIGTPILGQTTLSLRFVLADGSKSLPLSLTFGVVEPGMFPSEVTLGSSIHAKLVFKQWQTIRCASHLVQHSLWRYLLV